MTKRILLRRTVFFISFLLFIVSSSFGQSTGGPSFEVASVKPTSLDMVKLAAAVRAGEMPALGAHVDKARATYTFMTLRDLIATAYDVKPNQIAGAAWLNDGGAQRFDIVAKLPDDATPDQAPKMLQALLADRFKLAVHRDTKEQSVMALVVGSGGPKLQPAPAEANQDFDPNSPLKPGERQIDSPQGPIRMTVDPKGGAVVNMGKRGIWTQRLVNGALHLEGKGVTLSAFADMLSQLSGMTGGPSTPVIDMTGLTGNYVVSIDFSLQDLMKMAQAAGVAIPAAPQRPGEPVAAADPGSSSVFDAVKALGLKLESRKSPQPQLIIDQAEKMPTAN
jgi:uncharacterized protein (TIGR03435 family)